jgi:MFS transporter, DHA2 family, multidrug resistance protein
MIKNKSFLLLTLMLGTFMASIDTSIVNVSLPVIRKQFGVSITHVEWVITAYMIAFTLFIPLTNWLKKRIGYFRLFTWSLVIFTAGSVLCGLSRSLDMLVISRIIQAIGGGAISPTSLAILSENYPVEERGNAVGWWGVGNVLGPTIGPTLGGLLTHYFGWHSIFFVNVPVGIITMALTFRYLSFLKQQPVFNTKFDSSGYIFFILFVVSMQFTVSAISDYGIRSWQLPAAITLSVIFLYLYIRSSKNKDPLLDLGVFSSRVFNKAAIVIVIRSVALYGGMFFLPFLFQGLLGYTALQSGLILLPNALIMLVTRPLAGKLADRGYIRNASIAGILLVTISFVLFSEIGLGTSLVFIVTSMLVRGIGMSLLVSPVSTALLNAVRLDQSTTATSLNALLQQLGGSLGIAISGVIHAFIYSHYLNHYNPQYSEHFALRDSFLIAGFVIAFALLPAMSLPENAVVKARAVTGE